MQLGVPTAEVWNRVLWIRCGSKSGTAFTIEVDGRQFLVTAAHVVVDFDTAPLLRNRLGSWVEVHGKRIAPDPDFVDVAIFGLDQQLTVAMPIDLGHDGFVFGQDLTILGYPFDIDDFVKEPSPIYLASGSPLPMVKRANFAWERKAPGPAHSTLFLDCYANEGFSGGPVVGFKHGGSGHISIAGVVSHYVPDTQPVLVDGRPTALTARQNPGILLAAGIRHATDGIHAAGARFGAILRDDPAST